jgi:hypothetical protein
MTNVNATPEKRATRRGLFALGLKALEGQGFSVSRISREGKASVRRITKGADSYKVSIRTSQDTWIAFPRKSNGKGWVTLDDVDFVLAVSADDRHNPTKAQAHLIPGDEARARFDRAYEARKQVGYSLPTGRGIWLSLYDVEAHHPATLVGAGMGLDFPAIETRDINNLDRDGEPETANADAFDDEATEIASSVEVECLTISEAKRRLAATLHIPESDIKISIEH